MNNITLTTNSNQGDISTICNTLSATTEEPNTLTEPIKIINCITTPDTNHNKRDTPDASTAIPDSKSSETNATPAAHAPAAPSTQISSPPTLTEEERLAKIKRLKVKLINEEHRLVLMKKIRQSQTRPIDRQAQQQQLQQNNQQQAASAQRQLQQQQKQQQLLLQQATNSNLNPASSSNLLNPISANPAKKLRPSMSALPGLSALSPALGQQLGLKNQLLNANNLSQSTSVTAAAAAAAAAAALNQTPAHAHQRPKNNNLWNQPVQHGRQPPPPAGIAPAHVGNLSRQPITTPPNVVAMMNNLTTGRQQQQQQQPQQQSQPPTPQTPQNPIYNKSQVAQMLLQKRSAAKLALQKQVEQTLMQLPEKRVQSSIDFIPNANNIEFLYYLGLENCVDYLTNTKSPMDTQPLEKPYECINCGTDFTPSWSWKRSNPVCNNCVSNHVKKSIRNSQTSRIKSVMAKAAKQEQEMDQKIMADAANMVSSPSTPTTSTNQRHSLLQQPSNHSSPHSTSHTPSSSMNQRHSLLQQPSSHTSRSTAHSQSQPWTPRSNPATHAATRSSVSKSHSSNTNNTNHNNTTANLLPNLSNLNLSNPLAALGSLQPAALASLMQMNPQLSSLLSIMTGANAAPAPAPAPAPTPTPNNTNQIAQVAALLMSQLTMNMWNKR